MLTKIEEEKRYAEQQSFSKDKFWQNFKIFDSQIFYGSVLFTGKIGLKKGLQFSVKWIIVRLFFAQPMIVAKANKKARKSVAMSSTLAPVHIGLFDDKTATN